MNITQYIKSNPELLETAKRYKNNSFNDIVAGSDMFQYDAIIDDPDYGPNTKVIYIDGDQDRPWAVADIISRLDEKDVESDRLETWKAYVSRYQFLSEDSLSTENILGKLKELVK